MSIKSQIWSSENKILARKETIIQSYRMLFNNQKLPDNLQYWSMCGNLTDNNGNLNIDSEYSQLINSGLISEDQFHGVEILDEIYQKNKLILPNVNIYHSDFFQAMNFAALNNKFYPGIINADLISTAQYAAETIAKILELVSHIELPTMVIANIIIDLPYGKSENKTKNVNKFFNFLKEEGRFQRCNHKWNHLDKCYSYAGNSDKTNMSSYIFWKQN
jgi:hypothetical protein